MRAEPATIEVTCRIVFTKREMELLHHISSYGPNATPEGMASSHYAGGVSKDEIEKFLRQIREFTDTYMTSVEDACTAAKTPMLKKQELNARADLFRR